mgnify:FL=1
MIAPVTSLAQTPTEALSDLSQADKAWVTKSCPKSLGPSLWSACITREARAAQSGRPELSHLSNEHKAWVRKSCSDSLGPSLAISCLNRESAALAQGVPNIQSLTAQDRNWIRRSCSKSLGPSLWTSCVERELAALNAMNQVPDRPKSQLASSPNLSLRDPKNPDIYLIETAKGNQEFIINGEKYTAKLNCKGWAAGDPVRFLEGSSAGVCVSAEIYNTRLKGVCSVWCE